MYGLIVPSDLSLIWMVDDNCAALSPAKIKKKDA